MRLAVVTVSFAMIVATIVIVAIGAHGGLREAGDASNGTRPSTPAVESRYPHIDPEAIGRASSGLLREI